MKKGISREISKYFGLKENENENTTYQNFGDAAKVVLKGKFIALNPGIRKDERFKINKISFLLRKLEKEEQIQSKISRRK